MLNRLGATLNRLGLVSIGHGISGGGTLPTGSTPTYYILGF